MLLNDVLLVILWRFISFTNFILSTSLFRGIVQPLVRNRKVSILSCSRCLHSILQVFSSFLLHTTFPACKLLIEYVHPVHVVSQITVPCDETYHLPLPLLNKRGREVESLLYLNSEIEFCLSCSSLAQCYCPVFPASGVCHITA